MTATTKAAVLEDPSVAARMKAAWVKAKDEHREACDVVVTTVRVFVAVLDDSDATGSTIGLGGALANVRAAVREERRKAQALDTATYELLGRERVA